MARDGMFFYRSWYEQIKEMTMEEGYEYMLTLLSYGIEETERPVSGLVKIAFAGAKPIINTNRKKGKGGEKGGRPNKETNGLENEKPMVLENENQTHYNNKNKNKKQEQEQEINNKKESNRENRSPQFKKPTIAEIQEYCKQRGNNVDAEQFFSFYESNGWKVGRVPMKDWKMCVITWEKRDKKTSSARKYPSEDYRRRIEVPTMEDWENEQGTI